ncbi:hypothetical protein ONE63_002907 [Megalurothrips usitatus]|uniref:Protein-lysine N-methyltransferase SMYD4 n=1 Tax=Megalurothrips usitatus TaxID=439358 RepID=A0AAV7X9F5_9NEOP|nr:hypothetical protein ONE63_002907 [Megalurothrips usitatus]
MYLFEDIIFERLLDALKVGDRVVVTSHLFYEFKTDSERVALAHQLLDEENLLPENESIAIKCHKLSSDLRNEGNKAFQKKKDLVALQLYNRSLAAAPLNSKEYSLAIGNRSAVNWSLGFIDACLSDIDQALQSGYPNELKYKLIERQVKCYIKLGMKADAEKIIKMDLEGAHTKRSQQGDSIEALIQNMQEISKETCADPSVKVGCAPKPPLSFGVNPEIGCASSAIALKYTEEMGRLMVATKDIAPGDVLVVEQPFASVLLPDALSTHCYNCLQRCLSPIPCLHCAEVMFCNEKCRSECWERFHSIDCPLLPHVYKKVGKMGLLALRVLIVASQQGRELKNLYEGVEGMKVPEDQRTLGFSVDGQYVSTDYYPIHYLVGHSNRRANADLFRRSVTAACLLHCLETCSRFFAEDVNDELFYFSGGLLLRHLQSLPCNAHEVSEMIVDAGSFESHEIGAAGYATLSLLNHSCDPNVVRHSYGDWAVLRAIKPIREGEEILDNYGYHHALHSVEERRSQLSKQYFFHCTCPACQGAWPPYKDQPVSNPVYKCNCGKALIKESGSSVQVLCSCGAVTDIAQLESDVNASSKLFRDTLSGVLAGHFHNSVPNSLIQHLILLENSVQRPWREFSECQETIKQCLSLQANHVTVSN